MPAKKPNYANIRSIKAMAKQYGVDKNALFLQTVKNYETVQNAIAAVDEIIQSGDLIVMKSYTSGTENAYLNPALKELAKYVDAAAKLTDRMLNIIKTLGNANKPGNAVLDFINK